MSDVYWGDTRIRQGGAGGSGAFVSRNGETYYRIGDYDRMDPFLMTVVSASDHWMFVSSTGGLTCGRKNPENALFPYYTDDKIHDAHSTTGPATWILVEENGKTSLWQPFSHSVAVYETERNLYKNLPGNKLIFEEVNRDLGLVFSYRWSSSDRFGFVRTARLRNLGAAQTRVEVLDGLRNLLPYGVTYTLQSNMSTLVDAYKQAEAVPESAAAIFSMSSILTDRAEPSEALLATVAWNLGLDNPGVLLSEDQISAFCAGLALVPETIKKGQRGAFYVRSGIELKPGGEKCWYTLSDINQGPSDVAALLDAVHQGVSPQTVEGDIDKGTDRLIRLVAQADGCQLSADDLVTARHFSNTMFNVMRGGTFYDDYTSPADDFLDFISTWNRPYRDQFSDLLDTLEPPHTRASIMAAVEKAGDPDMVRLALEYLPLIFSRRHGDPSRPWNQFSIDIRNPDGSDKLYYQGNWRDIFQNWEALAISYPKYIENFIAKFVNASTVDGYNPYRVTRDGFDWETLDLDDPWSNIGYWGDHQVNYLVRLLELSERYHPRKISRLLARRVFVYADVPYRIKRYEELVNDPRNSIEYDDAGAKALAGRVRKIGSDGRLHHLADGGRHQVNLLEKLLVPVLSKMGNLVPGGGIWMNTQRPEWNDANNALVGYGLSVVTVCYLRRFLVTMAHLLEHTESESFEVSEEVIAYFEAINKILTRNIKYLEGTIEPRDCKTFMDEMGLAGDSYRGRVYAGFSGVCNALKKTRLISFIGLSLGYIDYSIASNKRPDGLFHAYNLLQLKSDGCHVSDLEEMLEGQVAVLSSGYLDPASSLELLRALRASKIYRSDKNSYMLYPYRKLPHFLEKNVIGPGIVNSSNWIRKELESGRTEFIERDINGAVHFNGMFRNAAELRAALEQDLEISSDDIGSVCDIYENVFNHRQFTGRSGAMYKYEGLGCIYWHMVSKLLLATAEIITLAEQAGAESGLVTELIYCYEDIKDGLGVNKTPADYGAFPIDPYSHTPAFAGVQQPGMTGQVKEDLITRFIELGVTVHEGAVSFAPVMLRQAEFTTEAQTWHFSIGEKSTNETLEAGSLAFSLCGVPVIYRRADTSSIRVYSDVADPEVIEGNNVGQDWSQSLFLRDQKIKKIIVDIPLTALR